MCTAFDFIFHMQITGSGVPSHAFPGGQKFISVTVMVRLSLTPMTNSNKLSNSY